jgi:hypothetical protein
MRILRGWVGGERKLLHIRPVFWTRRMERFWYIKDPAFTITCGAGYLCRTDKPSYATPPDRSGRRERGFAAMMAIGD